MDSTKQVKYRKAQDTHDQKKIVLIGFMGSGKSTLGPMLARARGTRFVDLDKAIVARAGCSIPALFKARGEDGFRALETEVLSEVLGRSGGVVIAAGGGVVARAPNRARLRSAGAVVVWVDVSWSVLWRRLKAADHRRRPLLAAPDGSRKSERQIRLFWQERRAIYASFLRSVTGGRVRVARGETARRACHRILGILGTL